MAHREMVLVALVQPTMVCMVICGNAIMDNDQLSNAELIRNNALACVFVLVNSEIHVRYSVR